MTADWAPKLVLRTSESPNWPSAHAIRSEAEASDRLRSAAAGSTAAVTVSAVGHFLGKAQQQQHRAALRRSLLPVRSWFHQVEGGLICIIRPLLTSPAPGIRVIAGRRPTPATPPDSQMFARQWYQNSRSDEPAADSRPRAEAMTTLVSMIRGINVGGNRPIKMDRAQGALRGPGLRQSADLPAERERGLRGPGPAGARAWRGRGKGDPGGIRLRGERRSADGRARWRRLSPRTPLPGASGWTRDFSTRPSSWTRTGGPRSTASRSRSARARRRSSWAAIVYVYCPNGYGTTRINNTFFERKLGVRATTRNWQTVTALEKMAREGAPAT